MAATEPWVDVGDIPPRGQGDAEQNLARSSGCSGCVQCDFRGQLGSRAQSDCHLTDRLACMCAHVRQDVADQRLDVINARPEGVEPNPQFESARPNKLIADSIEMALRSAL
ncbi:MAG: hypothetical protein MJE77_30165 [Proteobacteria bacterium]|nr:hypothetical protein [Pseudomonadota bacterium]